MTFQEISEVQKRINDLEGYLKGIRDNSSMETQAAINEALRGLLAVYDTTHAMDKAVQAKGC